MRPVNWLSSPRRCNKKAAGRETRRRHRRSVPDDYFGNSHFLPASSHLPFAVSQSALLAGAAFAAAGAAGAVEAGAVAAGAAAAGAAVVAAAGAAGLAAAGAVVAAGAAAAGLALSASTGVATASAKVVRQAVRIDFMFPPRGFNFNRYAHIARCSIRDVIVCDGLPRNRCQPCPDAKANALTGGSCGNGGDRFKTKAGHKWSVTRKRILRGRPANQRLAEPDFAARSPATFLPCTSAPFPIATIPLFT